jgi:glycosyltransferase involved in cell wall biosynthesis
MHFSIITPSHQRGDLLPEAVASVRASIGAPLSFDFEHLIYENGSTDNTAAFLHEATTQDGPSLRYWQDAERRLAGFARNKLISQTPADAWIVPLDDDDILLQRTLYHYAGQVQRHPGRPWLVADFLRVDSEGRYLANEDYYAWHFETPRAMLQAIFRAEHFIQGNVCFSRALCDQVGGYDGGLAMAEDLDLYVRFLLAGYLPVICPHISHLHRFHDKNVSIGVDGAKHQADLQIIYDKYAARLEQEGIARP